MEVDKTCRCQCGIEIISKCAAWDLERQMNYLGNSSIHTAWTEEGALATVASYARLLEQCERRPELEASIKAAIFKIKSHFAQSNVTSV